MFQIVEPLPNKYKALSHQKSINKGTDFLNFSKTLFHAYNTDYRIEIIQWILHEYIPVFQINSKY
jgi:hypothetical protein